MPHNRYYIDASFEENATLCLSGDEWHHLTCVLRSKKGANVELVNGRGQLAQAILLELKKNAAELSIQRITESPALTPPLILAQAIPRMNHLEWIVEKGTELNTTAFWLFPGLLSEKNSLSSTQQARLKALCISAMKQCGRLDLPEIVLKPPLTQWAASEGTLLFGDTAENAPYLWDASLTKPLPSPVIFFIGPERGFGPKERTYLLDKLKARGVRLHPNILRAETAPLVALAQTQPFLYN
jgi:16S rRNA (uracil1498-N3)-methyltransferase